MGGGSTTRPGTGVEWSLARLGSAQHGVVARSQLARLGITGREVERRLEAGRLHLVHRGVYAVGHTALTPRARLVAALLAVPSSMISHASAAFLWELTEQLEEPIELIAPRRVRRPGLVVHRHERAERTRHEGLPVTTPARTLLDLAATTPAERLERLVGEAFARRRTTRAKLVAVLDAHPGARGATTLRGMLDVEDTRSRTERAFLHMIRAAGLPRPRVNALVGRWRPDFLWPEQRVVVEVDGYHAHASPWAHERDRRKELALRARGLDVVRFTRRQVDHERPAVLLATMRALRLA